MQLAVACCGPTIPTCISGLALRTVTKVLIVKWVYDVEWFKICDLRIDDWQSLTLLNVKIRWRKEPRPKQGDIFG